MPSTSISSRCNSSISNCLAHGPSPSQLPLLNPEGQALAGPRAMTHSACQCSLSFGRSTVKFNGTPIKHVLKGLPRTHQHQAKLLISCPVCQVSHRLLLPHFTNIGSPFTPWSPSPSIAMRRATWVAPPAIFSGFLVTRSSCGFTRLFSSVLLLLSAVFAARRDHRPFRVVLPCNKAQTFINSPDSLLPVLSLP